MNKGLKTLSLVSIFFLIFVIFFILVFNLSVNFSITNFPDFVIQHSGYEGDNDNIIVDTQPFKSGEITILEAKIPEFICKIDDRITHDKTNSECFESEVEVLGEIIKLSPGEEYKPNQYITIKFAELTATFKPKIINGVTKVVLEDSYKSTWHIFIDRDSITTSFIDGNKYLVFDKNYNSEISVDNPLMPFEGAIEVSEANKLFFINKKIETFDKEFKLGKNVFEFELDTTKLGRVDISVLPTLKTNYGTYTFNEIVKEYNVVDSVEMLEAQIKIDEQKAKAQGISIDEFNKVKGESKSITGLNGLLIGVLVVLILAFILIKRI